MKVYGNISRLFVRGITLIEYVQLFQQNICFDTIANLLFSNEPGRQYACFYTNKMYTTRHLV